MLAQKTQCLSGRTTVARSARPSPVVCQAAKGESSVPLALCTIAAASISWALPSNAGVVLQEPALKKFDQTAAPKQQEKKEEKKEEGGIEVSLDARVLALPASILAIGGAGFAASKVDSGFSEWLSESGALVRKSDQWGGFEDDIKEEYPYVADGVFPSKGGGGAKKAAAPKKGGGFPFGKKK